MYDQIDRLFLNMIAKDAARAAMLTQIAKLVRGMS